MKKNVLKINPKDNVWVALQNITKGTVVSIESEQVTVLEDIAAKPKLIFSEVVAEIVEYFSIKN